MNLPDPPPAADLDPGSDDPLELMRRLEAVRDEGLDDADLRVVLAEVADALAHAAGTPAALSPHVRRAALAAYRARPGPAPQVGERPARWAAAPAPAATPPLGRSRPGAVPRPWLRVAAVLALALGVGLFAASRREAGASLGVAGLDRLALDGSRREVGSSRLLPEGTALGGQPGAFLVLTMRSGGRLLLGPDDEASIVGAPRPGKGHEARVALISGRALLDATRGAVELALGDGRTVLLLDGRAAVLDTPTGAVVLPDAAARFRIGDDTTVQRGPGALRVPPRRSVEPFSGERPGDLFEPLARLDGAPREPVSDARVAPRRWRVAAGAFHRRGPVLVLMPPSDPSEPVVVAWSPPAGLGPADVLELTLDGGEALVRARLDGAVPVPVATTGARTRIPLPPGWRSRLGGRELELEFTWPEADAPRAPLRFLGATFLRPPAVSAPPAAAPPASTGVTDESR